MWRITVRAYRIALLWRRGKLVNVLTEGKHWVGFCDQVAYYSVMLPLEDQALWPYLLEYDAIGAHLDILDIKDNEIGLESKDGLFQRVIEPGKIAYWKGPADYQLRLINRDLLEVPKDLSPKVLSQTGVFKLMTAHYVDTGQKGMLYVDGKYVETKPPGVYRYWKTNALVTMRTVDTRLQSVEVLGQEILTKDKAGIRINFYGQYQIVNYEKTVLEVKDYYKQLYAAMQLVLRSYISGMTLDQLLANKEQVGPYVVKELSMTAARLGLEFVAGGIKDVILPGDVKEIMNQVLVAQKRAQANTIMRQEETASTRSLLNTAKLMESNGMLLKLKEMEYMEKIADKVGEITVNGGGRVMDQLEAILVSDK